MVRSKLTKEGEYLPADMADMTLTIDQQQKVIYVVRLFDVHPHKNAIHFSYSPFIWPPSGQIA